MCVRGVVVLMWVLASVTVGSTNTLHQGLSTLPEQGRNTRLTGMLCQGRMPGLGGSHLLHGAPEGRIGPRTSPHWRGCIARLLVGRSTLARLTLGEC
jgi:hypothetical protein